MNDSVVQSLVEMFEYEEEAQMMSILVEVHPLGIIVTASLVRVCCLVDVVRTIVIFT